MRFMSCVYSRAILLWLIMLYIALLHCSCTMLDLIFVQVEITVFYWRLCLSIGGTNQARNLRKSSWRVLTNAMTCATCHILRIHTSLHQLSWANLCQPRGPSNHPWIASGQVERCSLLQVVSNVPCAKSCRSRCQFRWLIFIPDRETQEACSVVRGSCRWQLFPGWWQRQELAFHPGSPLLICQEHHTLLKWSLNDVI